MMEVGIFRKFKVPFISFSCHIPNGLAIADEGQGLEISLFADDCLRCHLTDKWRPAGA